MDQQRLGRRIVTLLVVIVLGIAYTGFLYLQPALTGVRDLDGSLVWCWASISALIRLPIWWRCFFTGGRCDIHFLRGDPLFCGYL